MQLLTIIILGCLCLSARCNTVDPRIIGGIKVEDRSQFAYQALLRQYSAPRCGGSIIGASHVLTAAHCVTYSNGNPLDHTYLDVVVGNLYLYDAPNVQPVIEIYVHENYSVEFYTADVAILKISETFGTWTDEVKPIKLATTFVTSGTCIVSGWGTTYSGGFTMYPDLLYVDVPVVDWSFCKEYYEQYLDERMICAGTDTKDACQGDSGGPFVCNGELVGIVSFGDGCAEAPGVYAEVAKHIDWINDKLNPDDPNTDPDENDPGTVPDTNPEESDPDPNPDTDPKPNPDTDPEETIPDPENPDTNPDEGDPDTDPEETIPDPETPDPNPDETDPDTNPDTDPEETIPDPEHPIPDPEDPIPDPEDPIRDPEDPIPDSEDPIPDPEEAIPDPEDSIPDPEEPTDPEDTVPDTDNPDTNPEDNIPDNDDTVPDNDGSSGQSLSQYYSLISTMSLGIYLAPKLLLNT